MSQDVALNALVEDGLHQDRIRLMDLSSDELRQNFIAETASWALEPPFYAVQGSTYQVVIGRYADAMEVYQDRTRFSVELPKKPGLERFDKFMGVETLAQLDGARHDRLRKLLSPAFGPGAMADLETKIAQVIDELLDPIVAAGGTFDAMEDFGTYLMPRILLDMVFQMGEAEKEAMMRMNAVLPMATQLVPGQPFPPEYVAAFKDARAAIAKLIEARRANLGDDLVSKLILAEDAGDKLTEAEMFDQLFSITAGALQSTASSIVAVLYVLHQNPEQLAMLRHDPSLIPKAIDECLRYHGAGFLSFPRFATQACEVGGTPIPQGSIVRISPQAACFDPTVFADPLKIDITRNTKSATMFGAGPHLCLGNRLARTVLRIALHQILVRLPELKIADPAFEPIYRGQVSETQISSLPLVPVN